jgi:hypothetical protein
VRGLPHPQLALLAAILGVDGRPRETLDEAAEFLGIHPKVAERIFFTTLRTLGQETAMALFGQSAGPSTGTA